MTGRYEMLVEQNADVPMAGHEREEEEEWGKKKGRLLAVSFRP
jgi:hypothetical protein